MSCCDIWLRLGGLLTREASEQTKLQKEASMLLAVACKCIEKDRYVISRLNTRHNYFVSQSETIFTHHYLDKSTMALLELPYGSQR